MNALFLPQDRLSGSGLRGHALLREFLRSKELMQQPIIFNELAPAREALLGQLLQQVCSPTLNT